MIWAILFWLLFGLLAGYLICVVGQVLIDRDKEGKIRNYPCIEHLNNALRYLVYDEDSNKGAISEICYCISEAQGKFTEDVKQALIEKDLFPLDKR